MCKELCEQTEEGRAIWHEWRRTRRNWKSVRDFHNEAVLAAICASFEKGEGKAFLVMCGRDGTTEMLSVSTVHEPES